jgi:hypothetical protein
VHLLPFWELFLHDVSLLLVINLVLVFQPGLPFIMIFTSFIKLWHVLYHQLIFGAVEEG